MTEPYSTAPLALQKFCSHHLQRCVDTTVGSSVGGKPGGETQRIPCFVQRIAGCFVHH